MRFNLAEICKSSLIKILLITYCQVGLAIIPTKFLQFGRTVQEEFEKTCIYHAFSNCFTNLKNSTIQWPRDCHLQEAFFGLSKFFWMTFCHESPESLDADFRADRTLGLGGVWKSRFPIEVFHSRHVHMSQQMYSVGVISKTHCHSYSAPCW